MNPTPEEVKEAEEVFDADANLGLSSTRVMGRVLSAALKAEREKLARLEKRLEDWAPSAGVVFREKWEAEREAHAKTKARNSLLEALARGWSELLGAGAQDIHSYLRRANQAEAALAAKTQELEAERNHYIHEFDLASNRAEASERSCAELRAELARAWQTSQELLKQTREKAEVESDDLKEALATCCKRAAKSDELRLKAEASLAAEQESHANDLRLGGLDRRDWEKLLAAANEKIAGLEIDVVNLRLRVSTETTNWSYVNGERLRLEAELNEVQSARDLAVGSARFEVKRAEKAEAQVKALEESLSKAREALQEWLGSTEMIGDQCREVWSCCLNPVSAEHDETCPAANALVALPLPPKTEATSDWFDALDNKPKPGDDGHDHSRCDRSKDCPSPKTKEARP